MADNTIRPAPSGGDTIRADELIDEATGLVGSKAQAMKLLMGRDGIDGGFASDATPLFTGADLTKWKSIVAKFGLVAERFERRADLNRRKRGGSMAYVAQQMQGGFGATAVYDPTILNLTGYWRASYAGSPWTPTASAGTSGANGNLAEATNPATTGAAQNGFTPADYVTNQQLNSVTLCQTFVSDASGSIGVLFYADTAVADPTTAAYYLGAGLWVDDTSGQIGLTFSAGGLYFGCSNGVDFDAVPVACSTGAWHFGQARWNGTTIEVRVDNGVWQTLARVVVTSAVDGIRQGINYDQTVPFDGRVLETFSSNTRLADGVWDDFRGYLNSRYAVSV